MISNPTRSRPTDFAALAKRISLWTSNGLLTVIVLTAGVGFGRQVLAWWAADSSQSAAALATALPLGKLGDARQCHVIRFGDQPWSLRRQLVMGDKAAAARRLQTACRELLQTGCSAAGLPPADDRKCPASLSGMKPLDEEPGKWRLYEFHEAFPMVIGTVRPPKPTTPAAPPADSQYHVAIWAAATAGRPRGLDLVHIPARENFWRKGKQSERLSPAARNASNAFPCSDRGRGNGRLRRPRSARCVAAFL